MGRKDRRRARQMRTFANIYQAHDRPAMRCFRYGIALFIIFGILGGIVHHVLYDGAEAAEAEHAARSAAERIAAAISDRCAGADVDAGDVQCGGVAPRPTVALLLSMGDDALVLSSGGSGGDGDGDGFRDFPRAWVRMGETLAATASRAARDAFGVEGMLGDECVWIGGESETTGEGESILSMALKCTLTEVKAVTRIAASASWQSVSYAELLALAEATPSRTLAPQSTATFATALSASYDDNARSEL